MRSALARRRLRAARPRAATHRSSRCSRSRRRRRPKLPAAIPEAFAKQLEPRGVRLTGADGKPACDLWICRARWRSPPKPTTEMRVKRADAPVRDADRRAAGDRSDDRLPQSSDRAGLLRTARRLAARRRQPPRHVGLARLRGRDRVHARQGIRRRSAKLDDLVKLSLPAAPGEHALALYVAVPEGDAPKDGAAAPLPARRTRGWAADLTLTGRHGGGCDDAGEAPPRARLVGHVSE